MPYIPKLRKRPPSARTKERHKAYNDKIYRDTRNWYMQQHPICEICEQNGLITPATECHHKLSAFDTNLSPEEKLIRLRDVNNLMSLCKECHRRAHHTTSKEEDEAYEARIKALSGNTYSV